MENLTVCINAVLPLLITMALGYMARRMGMLGDEEIIKLNNAAFFFLMPALMFNSIYTADLSTALNPKLLVFISLSLIVIYLLSLFAARRCTDDEKKQSVVLLGIYRANGPLLGLSLVKSLVPNADISAAAVLITLAATINNILAVLCMSMYAGEKRSAADVLRAIVKNPMLIGSALGLVFAYYGWRLPVFAERVVSDLSNMSSPLLLFLLGAFFKFEGVGKFGRELSLTCAARLLLVPAVFLPLGWLLGFRGVEFAGLIGALASPAAVTSFTMAQQMGADAELAGDVVVFTSALCPVTLFCWCMLAKLVGAV